MPTLLIDADPQHSLTDFLRVSIPSDQPTLLEVLRGDISAENAFYPVPTPFQSTDLHRPNLFLIPCDRALDKAQRFLAQLSTNANLLHQRLKPLYPLFDFIAIDTPAYKSHLLLTALGAADRILIPAEVAAKGIKSLSESLAFLDECRSLNLTQAQLLGILPFRAQWHRTNPTAETKANLDLIQQIAPNQVLPPILESEFYRQALNQATTLAELAPQHSSLEQPIDDLLNRLFP
jgi:chromosome partitioning protein